LFNPGIYAHAGNQPGVFSFFPGCTMAAVEYNLAERVEVAVQSSPYLSGRKLRIETEAGRVVLHGTVGTYFQKQMAQEALRRVDGVQGIDNRLVVVA
jgi:osmotically-inducible protein OsmY